MSGDTVLHWVLSWGCHLAWVVGVGSGRRIWRNVPGERRITIGRRKNGTTAFVSLLSICNFSKICCWMFLWLTIFLVLRQFFCYPFSVRFCKSIIPIYGLIFVQLQFFVLFITVFFCFASFWFWWRWSWLKRNCFIDATIVVVNSYLICWSVWSLWRSRLNWIRKIKLNAISNIRISFI